MSAFLVVLRVAGASFDVDGFLSGYPKFRPDATWRQGEAVRGRPPATTGGFNIAVGEGDASLTEVTRFCDSRGVRRMLAEARRAGAELLLDVAIEVGGRTHFTSSVSFSPAQLRVFGDLGMVLVVSGYPVSEPGDEKHEGPNRKGRRAPVRRRTVRKAGRR